MHYHINNKSMQTKCFLKYSLLSISIIYCLITYVKIVIVICIHINNKSQQTKCFLKYLLLSISIMYCLITYVKIVA